MTMIKGLTTRRTRSGVQVLRLHYSADPDRDLNWITEEKQKYSSTAAWDREQEIVHHAGGGELLFAEILNRHADKIIIRDPRFQIPPFWKRIGGFDVTGRFCTKWNERESTWRKSWSCRSRGTSQSRS
jgi:hypothetical protein